MDKEEKLPVTIKPDILTAPPSSRRIPPWMSYLMALLGFIYILNPDAGILEFIPDNLPFVGNLDEGVAYTLIWYGLLEFFEGRKYRREFERLKQQPPEQEKSDDA